MININLLPGEQLGEKSLGKFLAWVLTYGRYIIIGTEIIVLLAFLSRFKLDRDLTDLHASIAQKQAVVLSAYNLEKEVRALQNRLTIAKTLDKQRTVSPKLLATLEEFTPQDVTLSELFFEKAKLSLTATALSNDGFTTFLNNLSSSPFFADISLDDISKSRGGTGVEFKITMALVSF